MGRFNYKKRPATSSRKADQRTKRSRTSTTVVIARQPVEAVLRGHIRRIPYMALTRLPEVIDSARGRNVVKLQEDVVQACLQRILSDGRSEARAPRPEQVRTLRRLIFGQSDVLLIARTGFGKSLIFHAYSILTGKITLQLIPLTKLGDEQLCDIRRFAGAKPCLIDAKTKTEEKDMLDKVEAGQYTHVLLGPEQASSRSFRKVLKKTDLQARIGLVAIDECHLVMQWEKFRPAFTLLGELRTILHKDIVWFGCSATLDKTSETRVLNTAGFRAVGNRMYQTEVIRTSINRPDVALCVVPIPRGKLTSWDSLYFLLQSAASDGHATPSETSKTIVFIDGRRSVHAAAAWAMEELMRLSNGYSTNPLADERCVFNVVRVFTAHVAQYDRDLSYHEFLSPQSKIRLMFATTSLGMGINIPDVVRVVTWKIPITASLGDIWQRIGRGGRGAGLTSQAYVMLPYWLFDTEGTCRLNAGPSTPKSSPAPLRSARTGMRNQLPVDRARLRSYLSQCTTLGDVSDPEDGSQEVIATQSDTEQLDSQDSGSRRRPRYWTKTEMDQRSGLPDPWLRMVNSLCHRKSFLDDLGEGKLALSERLLVEKDRCCSACNPALQPVITSPPSRDAPLGVPRSGTHAHCVFELLEAFAVRRATALFGGEHSRFPMPAGAYMLRGHRLAVVYAVIGGIPEPDVAAPLITDDLAFNVMCLKVPSLANWDLRTTECRQLMCGLLDIKRAALDNFMKHSDSVRQRRVDRLEEARQASLTVDSGSSSSDVTLESIRRQRDDEVAVEVAEMSAEQAQATPPIPPTPAQASSPAPVRHMRQTPRRRPLQERSASEYNRLQPADSDVDATPKSNAALTFTPTTARGRTRTLTKKGKENYRQV